ncbi:MAG: UvrD-helicase domain-containing protein [Ornithinimicrobium sp.]
MTGPQATPELTSQQQAALGPRIRLIEAGPGARKTKTVVARLRLQAASGKRIALLSFTNAAVNVARSRCRDVPGLLEPPNFIGTFDSFFHRYVLTPAIRQAAGKAPTYLSSWDDLPPPQRVVRPERGGTGVRLSRFARQDDGTWAVNESRLSRAEGLAWDQLSDWGKQGVNRTGSARINTLLGAQVYDTSEARKRALDVLKDADNICLQRLAMRFQELIVDEFQDCDETEYQLLARLKHAGIHVVVVADPDQAIYEFRQTLTGLYEAFRGRLEPDEIANLTTCFRSTPAICSLVTSLRSIGSSAITPDPDHVGGPNVIQVVVGSKVKAGKTALEIVRKHGISGAQTRVIAHRRADARALIRAGKQAPGGVSQMEDLLSALAELRSGTDSRGRLAATRRIEALILSQFAWAADGPDKAKGAGSAKDEVLARSDHLALLEIEPEQLRVEVARFLQDSVTWADANACKASVRARYENFAAARPLDLQPEIGRRLMIPPKVWEFWTSRTEGLFAGSHVEGVRWGHVHGVKGEEFDAVVLAVPSRTGGATHVLDDWENDQSSEQRRVMYVGASRARKVLVLVVPPGLRAQIEEILKSSDVSYAITVAS